jgi:tetratricopeptide (TPR) repeat protein
MALFQGGPCTAFLTLTMNRPSQQHLIRQASGFLELAELLFEPDQPVPAPSATLLQRALSLLESIEPPLRQTVETRLLEAETLRALGHFEAALPLFRCAAQAAPQRVEPWLGIGWCLKRLDRLREAINALRKGLEACPRQPILHYNLACYLSLAGNVQRAIEHLTKAIAIDRRFRDLTQSESDFDPIRSDPGFVAATHLAC